MERPIADNSDRPESGGGQDQAKVTVMQVEGNYC